MKSKTKKVVTTKTEATTATVDFTQTQRDLMTAIFVVSLAINLFVLVGWVTLQVTSAYDAQVVSFLFVR